MYNMWVFGAMVPAVCGLEKQVRKKIPVADNFTYVERRCPLTDLNQSWHTTKA
jgi:hypothetical protein